MHLTQCSQSCSINTKPLETLLRIHLPPVAKWAESHNYWFHGLHQRTLPSLVRISWAFLIATVFVWPGQSLWHRDTGRYQAGFSLEVCTIEQGLSVPFVFISSTQVFTLTASLGCFSLPLRPKALSMFLTSFEVTRCILLKVLPTLSLMLSSILPN